MRGTTSLLDAARQKRSKEMPESFYGNGDPQWHMGRGRYRRSAFTAAEAKAERVLDIGRLRRFAKEAPEQSSTVQQIVYRLEACAPNDRCRDGACFECRRAVQRWFVDRVRPIALAWGGAKIVTIVPRLRLSGETSDMVQTVITFRNRLDRAFNEGGISTVIGAYDISTNYHKNGAFERHFRPHLWCLTPPEQLDSGRAALRKRFEKAKTIPVPLFVQTWNGANEALAYGVKPNFCGRVTRDTSGQIDNKSFRQRTTSAARLRNVERVRLLLLSSALGLFGSLYLRGIAFER